MENNELSLLDPLTGQVLAVMNPIQAVDSYMGEDEPVGHVNADTAVGLEKVDDEGNYLLTLTLDQAFMEADNTVYPLAVSAPSFTMKAYELYQDKMLDVPVYSGTPNANYGVNHYSHVGYVNSTLGVGRLLVKMPGIQQNGAFMRMTSAQISQAKLYLYQTTESGATGSSVLYVYRYTGTNWDEASAKCRTTAWNGYSASLVQDSQMLTSSRQGYVGFNVTEAVQYWKRNPSDDRGLIFKNQNESSSSMKKVFLLKEYGSNIPYVTVEFNQQATPVQGLTQGKVYGIKNSTTGKFIESQGTSGTVYQKKGGQDCQDWQFRLQVDNYYQIWSVKEQGYLAVAADGKLVIVKNCVPTTAQWMIFKDPQGKYRIINRADKANYLNESTTGRLQHSLNGYHLWEIVDGYERNLDYGYLTDDPSSVTQGGGYYSRQIAISASNLTGEQQKICQAAFDTWNASGAGVRIYFDNSSVNTITFEKGLGIEGVTDTTFGYYTSMDPDAAKRAQVFNIKIYIDRITNSFPNRKDFMTKLTLVHELGHALNLAHVPAATDNTIMMETTMEGPFIDAPTPKDVYAILHDPLY